MQVILFPVPELDMECIFKPPPETFHNCIVMRFAGLFHVGWEMGAKGRFFEGIFLPMLLLFKLFHLSPTGI